MIMALIYIENLKYSYGNLNNSLRDVKYELNNGEKNIVIGPNGSGKTTFLKCILGILKTEKMIKIDNNYVENIREYTALSTNIKDALHLSGDLSVKEFIKYHMKLKLIKEDAAFNMLAYFKLDSLKNKRLSDLSTGQEKMVYNTIALSGDYKIILLDEPLSSIDPDRARLLINIINKSKNSFIITTHDLDLIKKIKGSTLNIMIDGNLSEKISPGELIFSMNVNNTRPQDKFIEIRGNDRIIYLTYGKENNVINNIDDLLYLYEV
ncbi:hypothetical protein TZ01_08240 [Acidiplasma sp. MBA-1]|nr:hypothetical protein TZ01_08240 [Acidiplasma sp. MBA-1]